VEKIKPFDNSYAFLLSNEGKFVGHPNEKWLNTSYDDHYPGINSEHKVQDRIRNGKDFSFIRSGKDGKVYYSFAPIVLQGTDTPWSVGVCIPINTIHAKANDHMGTTILLGLIGLLVIITSIYYIVNRFLSPVNQMVSSLAKMSEGDISMDLIKDNSGEKRSEVNKMQLLLNKIVSGLIKKTDFARRIGEGDLNSELSLLSSKDTLGQSLLTMRDNLLKAQAEASERKKEDEKIQWTNKGIAQISDVLRGNTSDITELSEEIIVKVVKLLNVNQGGIFLKEDDAGVYYELKAAFAYDRKKYTDKSIKPGEGLLGACILERETIHLTEIPQNYIEITSGLGGANPTSLLIVPLKTDDDEIMGVIEIASFKEFLPHQISFVERIAESIASTIRSVRTNHHTNELLRKTQMQTEEMASKEEELRQNMEELQATQDEMNRARAEVSANNELMEKIIDLVPFPVFVKDHDFRYTLANQEQSKLFNMLPAQMIGKSDVQLLTDAVENENIQNTDLEVMTKNKKLILPEQKLTTSDGARRYLQTIKVPFKNNISGKTNILGVSIDRSDLRNAEVRIEEGYQEITRLKKLLEQS
jgi:methyl-accepting chemotaxis protein